MILYGGSSARVLDPLLQILPYGLSPLRTSDGAESSPGTAASSLHETIVISGSSSTSVSITGTIDDPE